MSAARETAEAELVKLFGFASDPDRVARAVLDLSRGTGQSVGHTASALAKAFMDPIDGVNTLNAYVEFKGDPTRSDVEDQILDEVEREYGQAPDPSHRACCGELHSDGVCPVLTSEGVE